jgi:hypothetical protein
MPSFSFLFFSLQFICWTSTATVLKLLLENPSDVWVVPTDIVAQLRFLNEANTGRKSHKKDAKDVKKVRLQNKKIKDVKRS